MLINQELIDKIEQTRKNYYLVIKNKKIKIRYYLFFWIDFYLFIKKNFNKYPPIIDTEGFRFLKIEINTNKIFIDDSLDDKIYRIDGLFTFELLNFGIEIMENHHLSERFSKSRKIKNFLIEDTFNEKDKMFRCLYIWKFKHEKYKDKYLEKLMNCILNFYYLSETNEKDFVIDKLNKVYHINEISEAIYNGQHDRKALIIPFYKTFKNIIQDKKVLKHIFNKFIEKSDLLYNYDSESDSDLSDLSDLEDDNTESSFQIEIIKNYSCKKMRKCLINFRGLNLCFDVIIEDNIITRDMEIMAKQTRENTLDCLVRAYKDEYKNIVSNLTSRYFIDCDRKSFEFD